MDAISETVETLLRKMTELTTTMPTLADVVATCESPEEAAGLLAEAQALGLVDVLEDLGPETLFVLSTLAAERLQIRPTFDSRRWVDTRTGKLIGPPDRRYVPRKAAPEVEEPVLMHHRIDCRQLSPETLALAAERMDQEKKRPYSGDDPALAPLIQRFYGLNAIWDGEEIVSGACPYCAGERIGIHGYCLKCHASGMDRSLEKPRTPTRRQMPRGQTLKGGV